MLAKRLKSVRKTEGLEANGIRFEFDGVNKVLLGRFDGRFMNESASEFYEAIRRYSTATGATAGVWDFSYVTEFAANAEFIRQLARSGVGHAGRSQSSRLYCCAGLVLVRPISHVSIRSSTHFECSTPNESRTADRGAPRIDGLSKAVLIG